MINLLAIPNFEIQIILLLYFILIEITGIYCLETNHEHIATSLKTNFHATSCDSNSLLL